MTLDRYAARSFRSLAVVLCAVIVAVAAMAPGAAADSENRISLTGLESPVAAADADDHSCAGVKPVAGKDSWAFALPARGARFSVVRIALIDGEGGVHTFETRGDGALIEGGRRAVVRSNPPGLALTGAVADISGSASAFRLTRTCPSLPGWTRTSPSAGPAVVPPPGQPAGSAAERGGAADVAKAADATPADAKPADSEPSGWTAAAYVALALLLAVGSAAGVVVARRRSARSGTGAPG